jgi:two-component system LytT family response regulator
MSHSIDQPEALRPVRAIVVDDEARARRTLEKLLQDYCPGLEVVGHAGSVAEAVERIAEVGPDLVFLDIEMPNELGFALFDHFPEPDFHVVFTTAYQQYAIQAFRVSALDYLLKPIEIEQLTKAVEKARDMVNSKQMAEKLQAFKLNMNEQRKISRLAIAQNHGVTFVDVANILYLGADGSYTHVVTAQNKLLVSKKLGEFEDLEQHPDFFRTHRSFLVNLRQLDRYVRDDGGYLLMRNGDKIVLSRNRKDDFFDAIRYL